MKAFPTRTFSIIVLALAFFILPGLADAETTNKNEVEAMAKFETWFDQDLKKPVKVHYLDGNLFSLDNNGNLLGVNVYDDGQPAGISGTVSASIIRADGVTVAAVGSLSGSKATVTLPQNAYAVPGVISIVMKLTSGEDITTLLAVVSNVYMSETDSIVDPGTIIPSIEELIALIEEAIASIPPDYSELIGSIGRIENAYGFENPMNSLLWARSLAEGWFDSNSSLVISGTETTGKAWKRDGTETIGSNYCYTKYLGITESDATGFVIVSGWSWGADYPLISFYDNSNVMIACQEVKGNTSHFRKIFSIPNGTSYFVVNGKNVSDGHAVAMKVAASTISARIGSNVIPYSRMLDSNVLSTYTDYTDVRGLPSNYIYSLDSEVYSSISNLPSDFISSGTLIKLNGNGTRSNKTGYSSYILFSQNKVWFGFDNGSAVYWVNSQGGTIYSKDVQYGLDYLSETSTTEGKAKHINGTEASNSTYLYKTFTVSGNEILLISGHHFSNQYPLYLMYDENGTLVSYPALGSTGYDVHRYSVTVPGNVRTIIVNGANAGSAGGFNIIPSIQSYNNIPLSQDVPKRRYLFVGDSYLQGYSHDGSNSGWGIYTAGYMGLTSDDYVRKYYGGARFSANGSNNTFTALLAAVNYPYDYFTDIVVSGGYNDWAYTESAILTGIEGFAGLAKSKYPVANIHVGFIAWNKAGDGEGAEQNWQEIHSALMGTTLPAYQKCSTKGAAYMPNVEFWINDAGITHSDGYHPSEDGNKSIAIGISCALLAGSAPIPASVLTPGGSIPLAANGTRGGIQIGYTQNGNNYPVQLSGEKAFVNVPLDTQLSTLREVPFTVPANAWTLSSGVYVANFTTAYVTSTSKEIITFDSSLRSYATNDISVSKKSGGGGLTFTTGTIPTGTISGSAYVFDNDDGKLPTLIEDTVVPIANGGTGQSSLSGAQSALGITALSGQINAIVPGEFVVGTDFNTILTSGLYPIGNNNTNTPTGDGNSNWGSMVVVMNSSKDTGSQTFVTNTGKVYQRAMLSGTWGSWASLSDQIRNLCGSAESFVDLWCVGTYVLGWGIVIDVVSNKTITITSAQVLDDTTSFVSATVTNIETPGQHLQRNIALDATGLSVTAGKAYLCKLTGSES